MNRLLEIGFQHAGYWSLEGEQLELELIRHSSQKNLLYAFVCDGLVKYVGKTTASLRQRMAGYRTPGESQSTIVRNHRRIREALAAGLAVEILALPDNGLLHYGQFHLNLAAGLKDDIIRVIGPEWNGGDSAGRAEPASAVPDSDTESEPREVAAATEVPRRTFTVRLGTAYYNGGFFNVGIAEQQHFGADGETIELRLGDSETIVLGTINRRANGNGTPRIMGGTGLRDWFRGSTVQGGFVTVQLLSPNAARLVVADPVA